MERKNQKINYMKKSLYNSLVGIFLKGGFRLKSQNIINKVLIDLAVSNKTSKHVILLKLFHRLNLFVEIRRVRSFRGKNLVPFSLNYSRRVYLISKWIHLSIIEDDRNLPYKDKLVLELNNLLNNTGSKSLLKKNSAVSESVRNRSNAHYRW